MCALGLWIDPSLLSGMATEAAKNGIIVTVFLLISAYAVGLTLAFYSVVGEERFIATPFPNFKTFYKTPGEFGHFISWLWLWLAHGFPKLPASAPANLELMQARIDVRQALETFPVRKLFSLIQYGSDQLILFRTFYPDRYKERGASMLTQAEVVYRRVLFALGVGQSLLVWTALACLRVGGYAIARSIGNPHVPKWLRVDPEYLFWVGVAGLLVALYLHFIESRFQSWVAAAAIFLSIQALCAFRSPYLLSLPYGLRWPELVALGALSLFGSFRLRRVANRWRELELIVTHSLIGSMVG